MNSSNSAIPTGSRVIATKYSDCTPATATTVYSPRNGSLERGMRSARGRTTASTASSNNPAPAIRVHTASIGASPAAMRYLAMGPENAKHHEDTNASASPAYLIRTHHQISNDR